jgi:hypothetical protein
VAHNVSGRFSVLLKDFSQDIERLFTAEGDLLRLVQSNGVRAHYVVGNAPRKGGWVMVVEFVLLTLRVNDNVSGQLAVVTSLKALIWKQVIGLLSGYLLFDLKAAYDVLANIGKLARYHEQMVTLFDLSPKVWATSSEARVWS